MHRLDVQIERVVPVALRALSDRPVVHEPRRVEQDVHRAEPPRRRPSTAAAVARVEPRPLDDTPVDNAFPRQQPSLVEVRRDHRRALARERHSARAPDPGGCSSDERAFRSRLAIGFLVGRGGQLLAFSCRSFWIAAFVWSRRRGSEVSDRVERRAARDRAPAGAGTPLRRPTLQQYRGSAQSPDRSRRRHPSAMFDAMDVAPREAGSSRP